MKGFIITLVIGLAFLTCYGQSKKELAAAKVKSSTEWTTKKENGQTTSYKSVYQEYDKNGNTTLNIEYDDAGNETLKQVVVYDKFKRKTSETVYDASKGKTTRTSYIYDSFNNVKEEMEFNGDKLVRRTEFTRNQNGDKTSETTYDGSGNLQKKVTYTYDGKKMKTGRTTVNTLKNTETVKKWVYTYF